MFFRGALFFLIANISFCQSFPSSFFTRFHPRFFYDRRHLKYGSKYRRSYKHQMGYTGFTQDHHCIPKQHRHHELLEKIGYDINTCDNLMIMPNKKGIFALNLHPDTLVHDGGHRRYNLYVKEQLDYIYRHYEGLDDCKYQFWLLHKHLRKNMGRNEDDLPWT